MKKIRKLDKAHEESTFFLSETSKNRITKRTFISRILTIELSTIQMSKKKINKKTSEIEAEAAGRLVVRHYGESLVWERD